MKTKLKSYGSYLGIALVGIAIGALLQFAKAWTEPTVAPPNASVGAPINTSALNQAKAGIFTAGALVSPTVCIGSDCKSAWPSASGDNLGNHTATQALNMNGNAIAGASGMTVNMGGINLTLKYINGTEDVYGGWGYCSFVNGGSLCPKDTCDGSNAIYQCKVDDSKSCVDVTNSDVTGSELSGAGGQRTITCKKTAVFSE